MRAEQVETQLVQLVAAGGAPDGRAPMAYIAEALDEWEGALAAAPVQHRPGDRWVADWRKVMGLPGG